MQNCACITYLSISNFLNKQAACKSSTSILLAVIERHIAGKPANKISTSSLNHNNPKLTCQMVFDGRRIDRVTAGFPVKMNDVHIKKLIYINCAVEYIGLLCCLCNTCWDWPLRHDTQLLQQEDLQMKQPEMGRCDCS